MCRQIYMDNSATTRPYDEVIEYMSCINKDIYGNPSSLHRKGIEAERIIKKSRVSIANSINADKDEIYFTSGGTESNNFAIRGYLNANKHSGSHIVTLKTEHPSVLEVYKHLANMGYSVDFVDVDSKGVINLEQLEKILTQDTSLISIILVNNETGTIQPIDEIIKIKNKVNRDICIHVDAVQAFGKIKLDVKKGGYDLLSVSSHKIHGPKGVGALYINKKRKVNAIVFGGGQESMLRSGTENVPGIGGFAMAAEITYSNFIENYNKVTEIRDMFVNGLESEINGYKLLSPKNGLPYILNISFENVKAEVLLHFLEQENIYVSTGAACSSRKNIHSHVLTAMGVQKGDIEGSIRFSFSSFNSVDEVPIVIDALKKILPKIKITRK